MTQAIERASLTETTRRLRGFNRGTNAQAAQAREAFRSHAGGGRQELARGGGLGAGEKGGRGDRGDLRQTSGVGERGGLGDRSGGGNASRLGDRPSGSGRGGEAFQGVGNGGQVRSASERGAASRGGGGFHGGGGRR